MENIKKINVTGLLHSGKRKSYPSKFVWDCSNCNSINVHQTKVLRGEYPVFCRECETKHILNKEIVKKEITRSKKSSGNIYDLFY